MSVRTASFTSGGTSEVDSDSTRSPSSGSPCSNGGFMAQLLRYVVGNLGRLLPNVRHRNNFPVASLGQRTEGPQAFAGGGARALVDFETDAEMIGTDLTGVEQASEKRIAGPCNRVQRTGPVEGVIEAHRVRHRGAPLADRDLELVAVAFARDDPAGNDLQ